MRRHGTDGVSLAWGLIFLVAPVVWVFSRVLHRSLYLPNGGWIVAGALIALGILGVVASLRRSDRTPPEPVTDPVAVTAPPASDGSAFYHPHDEAADDRDPPTDG
jgi:hypothetical protein